MSQDTACRRLVHKADFERLLGQRSVSRSAHFAIHHVSGAPLPRRPAQKGAEAGKLSTEGAQSPGPPVNNLPPSWWFGCVVPKRHARRSVTRSLLKRQMRSVFARHAASLTPGLWLLRLAQGFAVAQFPSARSQALTQAVRAELEQLLLQAQRVGRV